MRESFKLKLSCLTRPGDRSGSSNNHPRTLHPRTLQEGKNVSQNTCSLDYQAPTHKSCETPQEAPSPRHNHIVISSLTAHNRYHFYRLVLCRSQCLRVLWHAFGFNALTAQRFSFELCDGLIHARLSFPQQVSLGQPPILVGSIPITK